MIKICGENFPSGEFREIRETSRRENFPGNFLPDFQVFPGNRFGEGCEKVASGKLWENYTSEIPGARANRDILVHFPEQGTILAEPQRYPNFYNLWVSPEKLETFYYDLQVVFSLNGKNWEHEKELLTPLKEPRDLRLVNLQRDIFGKFNEGMKMSNKVRDLFYFTVEKGEQVIDKCNIYFKDLMFQLSKDKLCNLIVKSMIKSPEAEKLAERGEVLGVADSGQVKAFFQHLLRETIDTVLVTPKTKKEIKLLLRHVPALCELSFENFGFTSPEKSTICSGESKDSSPGSDKPNWKRDMEEEFKKWEDDEGDDQAEKGIKRLIDLQKSLSRLRSKVPIKNISEVKPGMFYYIGEEDIIIVLGILDKQTILYEYALKKPMTNYKRLEYKALETMEKILTASLVNSVKKSDDNGRKIMVKLREKGFESVVDPKEQINLLPSVFGVNSDEIKRGSIKTLKINEHGLFKHDKLNRSGKGNEREFLQVVIDHYNTQKGKRKGQRENIFAHYVIFLRPELMSG